MLFASYLPYTAQTAFHVVDGLIHLVVIANIHAVEEIFHVRIIIK